MKREKDYSATHTLRHKVLFSSFVVHSANCHARTAAAMESTKNQNLATVWTGHAVDSSALRCSGLESGRGDRCG